MQQQFGGNFTPKLEKILGFLMSRTLHPDSTRIKKKEKVFCAIWKGFCPRIRVKTKKNNTFFSNRPDAYFSEGGTLKSRKGGTLKS